MNKDNLKRLLIILLALTALKFQCNAQQVQYDTIGIKNNLPVFYGKLLERQDYSLSWLKQENINFDQWKRIAAEKLIESYLAPPVKVPFNPVVINEQDRGSYVARKVVFSITGDSRILAFMLVPKSPGRHPAVLLLHDHGAEFRIGKEKVIEPWDEQEDKTELAKNWVNKLYGGKFIGDELAKKGYVCLATDMLNWGDRAGGGYEGQQAIASNLFNMGSSFAGLIAWEDLQAASFLSEQKEVDPDRIAAVGLSTGGFRSWQIAALSDHIAAAVSVCWMATHNGMIYPGSNMSGGQSAFTMTHPGLSRYLDYPDVASIACPKPLMFCCGDHDPLFPLESIKEAFAKMNKVWLSQNAGNKLVTNIYDSAHEFNLTMQADAFLWLDKVMGVSNK